MGYLWTSASMFRLDDGKQQPKQQTNDDKGEEEEPDPPRNFTAAQLLAFHGRNKDGAADEDVPVYLSVGGTVFDVSTARHFYGPE